MRVKGWETRLYTVTRRLLTVPFDWGTHNCIFFAADCVEACTGIDHAAPYRGTIKTQRDAMRLMAQLDCQSVDDVVSRYLPEMEKAFTNRGDLILAPGREGEYIAVVEMRTAVGPTTDGLQHTPKANAIKAWRVI